MLTIDVVSFSYKKGYPADSSGNGGGFMFDCRFLHNPGRYAEYKHLTGLDESVRSFIENESSMAEFLDHAYAIVESAVANYQERGFEHLLVGFGCTGGQHRSVYAAEAMASRLASEFREAKVIVTHREQGSARLMTD